MRADYTHFYDRLNERHSKEKNDPKSFLSEKKPVGYYPKSLTTQPIGSENRDKIFILVACKQVLHKNGYAYEMNKKNNNDGNL